MTRSGGRNFLACFAVIFYRKGNTKFFARLNDLQIGQAKTTKKFNGYIPCFAGAPAGPI
jgi:hypothetical protein